MLSVRRMWCVVPVACGLVAGCGGNGGSLSASDFASDTPAAAGAGTPAPVYSIAIPEVPEGLLLGATDGGGRQPGAAFAAQGDDEPMRPLVLDGKVGDVNGRPIIASVFLEDLTPRLRALTQTTRSVAEWRQEATKIIFEKLNLTIRDEVLYREAQAKLPEEQRQGLLAFLGRRREQIRLLNAGSESKADKLVREYYGQSLEEFLRDEQRGQLISEMLENAANDYPPVTWSDIKNEYDRRADEFNPPPTVFARMILPADEALAEAARARLDAGDSFADVASDRELNRYRPSAGGRISDEGRLVPGGLSGATLVGFAELNEALVALDVGDWAGPIEYGEGRLGFVHLERIEQSSRSLEDGQLQLELRAEIETRRERAARERFFVKLIEDAGFDAERQRELTLSLLSIAEARLYASER